MHVFFTIACFTVLALADVIFHPVNNTGSGCDAGSVLTTTAPNDQNSTNLIHTLENFAVRIGSNIPPSEDRLDCTVFTRVSFTEPQQRLYLNMDVGRISGYLAVDGGTQVNFKARYNWVVDRPKLGGNDVTFLGPLYSRFDRQMGNQIDDGDIISPCGSGLLQTTYTIRAYRNGPAEDVQVPEEPKDARWQIGTSFRLLDCEST